MVELKKVRDTEYGYWVDIIQYHYCQRPEEAPNIGVKLWKCKQCGLVWGVKYITENGEIYWNTMPVEMNLIEVEGGD